MEVWFEVSDGEVWLYADEDTMTYVADYSDFKDSQKEVMDKTRRELIRMGCEKPSRSSIEDAVLTIVMFGGCDGDKYEFEV